MRTLRTNATVVVFGVSVFAFLLSGCTINLGTSGMPNNQGMMGNNSGASQYSGMDIMFAQMMISHHQQALEMSELAQTRASDQSVMNLASEIAAEQQPEIDQMKEWLKAANASDGMGHDMGMDGMLSESQMDALEAASGAEFDRLFLEGMILHHGGAIQMVQMVINSSNTEVKALAEAIVESQTSQITYMESLLAK